MNTPSIVSPQEWQAAHEQMLVKEKAMTRAHDALVAERRRMPWMAVDKAYAFEGPKGKVSLQDLFAGRRQLIVYRAFFEPGVHGWPEHACIGCSMVADQVSHLAHLNARDTTLFRSPFVHAEVLVEFVADGVPGHRPAHPRLEALDILLRRARGERERGVSGVQVRGVGNLVGQIGRAHV